MNTDLPTQLRRLEQQLAAFEKLHADELKQFEEKLAAYMRLQAGEAKLLREELAALRTAVEAQPSQAANAVQNNEDTHP